MYDKSGEEKTGQDDFRPFAEQFEERGMKGFDPREKTITGKTDAQEKTRYPRDPETRLDLHGMKVEEGRQALLKFIRESRELGKMFVLVIPGLGRNSEGGQAKLRPMAVDELARLQRDRVIRDFKTAEPRHGGFGAIYVYLK